MAKKSNKKRKKNGNGIIIAAAAAVAVIVIVTVVVVLVKTDNPDDTTVALQDNQILSNETAEGGVAVAEGDGGYVEMEEGVYVNANGDILDENGIRDLEEGEDLANIEVQVKKSADYVEPGQGTLNINKIQGFTGKKSGGSSNNTSVESGNQGNTASDGNNGSGETDNGGTSAGNNGGESGTGAGSSEGTGGNGADATGGNSSAGTGENGSGGTGGNSSEGTGGNSSGGTSEGNSGNTTLADSSLKVESFGSYTGNFLEDGSDKPISDVAAMLITNTSDQMLQIAQITFQVNDSETATFKVTDLPAGTSALVLEQNGRKYSDGDNYSYGETATSYINPSMQSDKFDITMQDGKVQLNNKTGEDYSKVYVYYKYVQLGGAYKGGITYRTPVENVPANGSAEAIAGHMNPDSTQIVDVQIVE